MLLTLLHLLPFGCFVSVPSLSLCFWFVGVPWVSKDIGRLRGVLALTHVRVFGLLQNFICCFDELLLTTFVSLNILLLYKKIAVFDFPR